MTLDQHNKTPCTHHHIPFNNYTKDPLLVRIKVEEDIAFLQGRIASLKNHARPNRIVLETYQDMLNSRFAVLKWLLHGARDSESADSGSHHNA